MPLLTTKHPRTREALWLLVGLGAFLAILVVDRGQSFNYPGQPRFWDAHVYERAFQVFQAGGNPYLRDSPLVFVYPPVVLYAGAAISHVLHGAAAWRVYLTLNLLAVATIPVVIAVGYIRSSWLNAGCALLIAALHPFFTSAFSFFTGNVSNLLYAAVLLAGVPGVRRNRWLWFYIAVVLAATVKIAMLTFLLLPIFLGSGQWLGSSASALLVLACNALQRMVDPAAYQNYLAAAHYQVLERNDFGFGMCATLFRLLSRAAHVPHAVLLLAHTLICAALLLTMVWASRRGVPQQFRAWWVALVLLAALLCSPRLLVYDLDLMVVPTAFLLTETFGACLERKKPPMFLAGFLLAAIVVLHRNALDAYCFLAAACFPFVSYVWLGECRGSKESGGELGGLPNPLLTTRDVGNSRGGQLLGPNAEMVQ